MTIKLSPHRWPPTTFNFSNTPLILSAVFSPALAEKRLALVIGNGKYEHVSGLSNPTNDAAAIAAALQNLGFAVQQLNDVGRNEFRDGLAEFSSFAAKEGTVAADGDARHSPYTSALLSHLDRPGVEINKLFRLVRDDVLALNGGSQEPYTYGSTSGRDLFLSPPLGRVCVLRLWSGEGQARGRTRAP